VTEETTEIAVGDAASGAEATDDETTAPTKSHRKGRSSVPSWDEIMFGGGKSE
jgi:hypothetical protein